MFALYTDLLKHGMLVELWHCKTSTRDFLQKLRLGSLLASQQCKLGSGPLAHLLGIHALCLKKEAKHSIMQYFNMLVSNQRNIPSSNIRRSNPVTQADKSCLSLGNFHGFSLTRPKRHLAAHQMSLKGHVGRNLSLAQCSDCWPFMAGS